MRLRRYEISRTKESRLVVVSPIYLIVTRLSVGCRNRGQLSAARMAPRMKLSTRLESGKRLRRKDARSFSERCLVEEDDELERGPGTYIFETVPKCPQPSATCS